MESHAQDIKNQIVGQRAIRKTAPQTSDLDKKAKANLAKVIRIRIPAKRCYQQPSPKKGSPKKRKLSTASSQESADEQGDQPHESDTSQDFKVAPKQHGSTLLVDTTGASTRRSARDKKKPKRYGDLTGMSSSDESLDNGQAPKYQRNKHRILFSTQSNPCRNQVVAASQRKTFDHIQPKVPVENIGNASQDINEDPTHEDVLAIFVQDQPERPLQPHEFQSTESKTLIIVKLQVQTYYVALSYYLKLSVSINPSYQSSHQTSSAHIRYLPSRYNHSCY